MVNKKTVKKAAPKKVAKKTPAKAPAKKPALKALKSKSSVQDAVLNALNHLIELSKAALYDSFRAYVESKMAAGFPATLEEFLSCVTKTLAVFGISDKDLVESLEPKHTAYLTACAKALDVPKKAAAPKTTVTAVKTNGVAVQSEQATKVDVGDFGLSAPVTLPTGAALAKAPATSVFADLDVIG